MIGISTTHPFILKIYVPLTLVISTHISDIQLSHHIISSYCHTLTTQRMTIHYNDDHSVSLGCAYDGIQRRAQPRPQGGP